MTSPIKGFRAQKQPTKKVVQDENSKLRTALEALQGAQKFVMQQLMRVSQDVNHQGREIGAMTNLVGTQQISATDVLADGDVAIINFAGVMEDGLPLDGGSGKKTAIRLGSNAFIPGFESGLIGKRVGETLDLDLTFPETYAKELAGKKVSFRVQIVDGLRDRVSSASFDSYVQELDAKKAEAAKAQQAEESKNDSVQEANEEKAAQQEQSEAQ